ncbi:helix-turn-helix domain-containing protein [Microvirga sp. 2MCAF35]|uniref:helix-turn-helix domain-containing protein n=1 Tax=Microvirga sp. 2MCAF35 TaxID=3232987 RepID=UPI003F9AF1CC
MGKSTHTARYRRLVSLIVEARLKAKLTQGQVAEKLGKFQSQIASIESGGRRIDLVEFLDLCEAIGLDPLEAVQIVRNTAEADLK